MTSSGIFLPLLEPDTRPGSRLKLSLVLFSALSFAAFSLAGCGAGGSARGSGSALTSQITAPVMDIQPANQSVPMGLPVTFSVEVTGSSLTYQWFENGTPIFGATVSAYTVSAAQFADSGSVFTVKVSNSAGAVTSAPATLTVTARAPMSGDLRFRQVDAASTVNGYDNGPVGWASAIPGRMVTYFGLSLGTPFVLSDDTCDSAVTVPEMGCAWLYSQYYLPASLANLDLSVGYGADTLASFQTDLKSSTWQVMGAAPIGAPNSVITSLDFEPANDLFAASWIQSGHSSGFDLSQQTVTPDDLQAAATQEGAHSRVITAVSYNSGQVTYLSYGWTSDTATVYEAKVETATLADVPTAAASLAAEGYIITATGGADPAGGIILVGTRVAGDTMPRPFMTAKQGAAALAMMQQGYATVGIVEGSDGLQTYLGER